MNTIIRIIVFANFLFFGGWFLIALGQFVLYNGMGDLFEYIPSDRSLLIEKKIDRMPNQLVYKYFVGDKEYDGSQNVSSTIIFQIDPDSMIILYNKYFESFSMVKGFTGKSSKSWDQAVAMIVMGFFFLFIFVIYKFSDMSKWVGVYTRGEYKSSRKK